MAKLTPALAFERAQHCVRIGRFNEAVALVDAVLKSDPSNGHARNLKKTALSDQKAVSKSIAAIVERINAGNFGAAAKFSTQALKLHPDNAVLWNLLGVCHDALGALDKSRKALETAIHRNPEFADAHSNLGKVLHKQGHRDAAIASYRAAVKLSPRNINALNSLAVVLQDTGRTQDAIQAYNLAVRANPNHAGTYNNLGTLFYQIEEYEKSASACKRALDLAPGYVFARKNLAIALEALGQLEMAEAEIKLAIDAAPEFVDAYLVWHRIALALGNPQQAEDILTKAVEMAPNSAEGFCALGSAQVSLGKLDQAEGSFLAALSLKPDFPDCLRNLCSLGRTTAEDPVAHDLKKLLNRDDFSPLDKSHLHFAMAYVFEHDKDYARAFGHLKTANAFKKQSLGYDFQDDQKVFKQLKANGAKFETVQPFDVPDENAVTPIFILGMPRSGTTLLEQIISAHSDVSGAGELSFATRFGLDIAIGKTEPSDAWISQFRHDYLNALRGFSNGASFVTDKMPHNFRLIGLLQSALPEARFVHVKRDPAATCWSNFKKSFNGTGLGYSYDLATIVEYYQQYEALMAFWEIQFPDRIITVDYDLLTQDQEACTRAIIRALGLTWEDACLAPQLNKRVIRTASDTQVRKAVYSGSSENWKHYRPYIEGAFDLLFE